jgi:hypothetical protein
MMMMMIIIIINGSTTIFFGLGCLLTFYVNGGSASRNSSTYAQEMTA